MRGPFHGVRRFLSLGHRSPAAIARDVDDEVEFHLAMKARELEATGLSAQEAARRAREAFGDVDVARRTLRAREVTHERQQRRLTWLSEWGRDCAHAVRQLQRAPGFALLVVATLGMGIGATTAIFSAVHAILLAPLPFREPEQLVRVMRETPRGTRTSSSGGDFLEFQRTTRTLSGLTSYSVSTGNLAGFGAPQRVVIARTSHNFLDVMGMPLLLGRTFTAAEDTYKAAEVALLSEGTWQRLFGGDRQVLGRTVRMDGQGVQIIGVVPEGRGYPEGVELWLPAKYEPALMSDENRGASFLRLIGRLAPGVTLAQADAEFREMSRSISERFPDDRSGTVSTLVGFESSLVGDVRGPLWILLGAVVLVLLVACTNVAALLLGRVMARETELSIRASLGAGRGRLMRQLLTESTTLGLMGAVAGAIVAVGLVRLLVRLAPDIPRIGTVEVNAPVLAFSIGLGILTGLVFGVVPAWHASRQDLQVQLRAGGRGQTGSRQVGRMRGALVIGQFAMAIVLLTGAGLLVRTFLEMRAVDPGFATRNVTMFTVTLPQDGSFDGAYGGTAGQRQFLRQMQAGLAGIPGVDVVGATFGLPLSPRTFVLSFAIDGRPAPAPGSEPDAQLRVASPGYFAAMNIPVMRGRGFTSDDRDGAPLTLLVSEALVQRHFPGEEVLGKRLTFGWSRDSMELSGEVVGVVRDVRGTTLTGEHEPMAYVSADQWPVDELTFVLKSALPVGVVGAAAASVVKSVDEELPLYDLQSTAALVQGALATTRFYLVLLSIFASVALLLATLGIYGVVSFGVQQRTREIGVRIALGASVRRVQAMIVRDGLRLVAAGIVLGLAGALALTGLLGGVLFGVGSSDPVTYIAVTLLLTAAAVAACVVPARRAARIDPQEAMRVE